MRRQRRFLHQVIVVAHFEGVIELFFAGSLERLIGGRKRYHLPVRTPRELLHAGDGLGDLHRIPTCHRHHEYLRLGVDSSG